MTVFSPKAVASNNYNLEGPELTIVVPTFNEADNVIPLYEKLADALHDIRWEVVFVDDNSPDGTSSCVKALAQRNVHARCLRRIGRRGLSSACIEGFLSSSSPYLAVIDGDLQHDERLLPKMLEALRSDEALDIVVGSRYISGGGIGKWQQSRALMSRLATRLSQMILHVDLSDPMSGFFMFRSRILDKEADKLSGIGFKILLDLFASAPEPLKFLEIPYEFRTRQHGESKMDCQVMWNYLLLLGDKAVGHYVPIRFLSFSLVGSIGVFVDISCFELMTAAIKLNFLTARIVAVFVAMTSNFLINNLFTYRDCRLKGWKALRGWLSFCLSCFVGALSNAGVSSYLYDKGLAPLLAVCCGIVVGAILNYTVTSQYTWKTR